MAAPNRPSVFVPSIDRVRSEAANLKRQDAEQRAGALNILSPTEVKGDYDASRALYTTLGRGAAGGVRQITSADLAAFRRNIATIGKKYTGGIKAQDVLAHALKEDRDRANEQIRTALPVWARRGQVHFITNAGPDSEVTRHHVDVILMGHSNAVAAPKEARTTARSLVNDSLKFDCDCGRHRFWYRYIATIGKFNAGRDETGYPKIRNPKLRGVACKHVLRVMKQLTSVPVQHIIAKMIEADRAVLENGKAPKPIKMTPAQLKALADKQAREARWKRNAVASRPVRLERVSVKQVSRVWADAAATRAKNKLAVDRVKLELASKLARQGAKGGLTAEQAAAILAILKPTG